MQLRGIDVGLTVSHNSVEAVLELKAFPLRITGLSFSNLPVELYAKEVHLGGIDLMNQTIHVTSGTPITGTVEVLLSPNVSQNDGSVLDEREQPISVFWRFSFRTEIAIIRN